ncbi:tetratricopeptide repeat protein [Methylocucumis oryzae]|uniref:tetratricopeptide repeat protein n=1 Tax=Methylocucumis oryzae TaxID=1632867 RepID=UPI000695EC87|nr:tetratricopeptide repeat protein [Methylocucumis oryzae]
MVFTWFRKLRFKGTQLVLVSLALVSCASTPDQQVETESWQSFATRGNQELTTGNTDAALALYVKSLNLNPNNAELLNKIGAIHADRRNFNLAEEAYRLALKQQPGNAATLTGLGLLLIQQHRREHALPLLKTALNKDASCWRCANGLALLYDQQQHYSTALAYYQQALKILPNSAQVLTNRGYSHYLAGHWADAERDYREALRLEDNYRPALQNLALLQTRQGKVQEALTTFQKTTDIASAYNNIGYIFMLDGNYGDAEQYLEQAISLSPVYHTEAFANLTKLHELWRH